ncbi:MAG: hypothetical protein MUF54_18265 [Polyangiaceae bacterium]|jgi:hypothetical protein|nr:hypothetical protein [Polyangiaceae bacterium]
MTLPMGGLLAWSLALVFLYGFTPGALIGIPVLSWALVAITVGVAVLGRHRLLEVEQRALRQELYHARLLPAHFTRLRLGLRCVLKTKRLFRALLGPMLA